MLSMQNLLQYSKAGLVAGPLQPDSLLELEPWLEFDVPLLSEPDETLLEPEELLFVPEDAPLLELEPLDEPLDPLLEPLLFEEPLLDKEELPVEVLIAAELP
jgi:hypothetical protein